MLRFPCKEFWDGFFAPIVWLMGVPWSEATEAGKLLGIKTALNEFVAYAQLAVIEDVYCPIARN